MRYELKKKQTAPNKVVSVAQKKRLLPIGLGREKAAKAEIIKKTQPQKLLITIHQVVLLSCQHQK
jgi:hypothetical protein